MRVGMTLVAPDAQPAATPPAPASLDYPASPSALLCRSENQGYRECRTPFRGRAVLAREADGIGCIQEANWGWRDGAVWVDHGCAAVFVQETAALGESPAA